MDYRIYMETEKSYDISHKINEDCYMFSEYVFMNDQPVRVMAVADGMGGLEEGDQASKNAIAGFFHSFYSEIMLKYMNTSMEEYALKYDREAVEFALIKAIQKANEYVCRKADPLKPTGTTLSAACIIEDFAVIANVGDSPVYFYRKNKRRLKLVSTLQTQAEMDVQEELYERYSSEYYANDHRIYCSLGQYNELRSEDICVASIGRLDKGDIILLGSDGAFGRMQEYEILEQLDNCPEEDEAFIIDQLFELARMDKYDDQTAIMYVCG